VGVGVDFESWVQRAVDQVTRHRGMDAAMQEQCGILFMGCTINIVTGGHAGTELRGVPFAADTDSAAMPAAVRPVMAPGTHPAE